MTEISVRDLILGSYRPKKLTVLGVTGQAGAGKTSFVTPLILETMDALGIGACKLSLDDFFILSSSDRKEWLEEGNISKQERARRENLLNWWNFKSLREALGHLKNGSEVELRNVYDRSNDGKLTGHKVIVPPASGFIVLEGVAIAHITLVNKLIFVTTTDSMRLKRLHGRDGNRKRVSDVTKRLELCNRFAKPYFLKYRRNFDYIIQNNNNAPIKVFERDKIKDWIN